MSFESKFERILEKYNFYEIIFHHFYEHFNEHLLQNNPAADSSCYKNQQKRMQSKRDKNFHYQMRPLK